MVYKFIVIYLLGLCMSINNAFATIKTQAIEYTVDNVIIEGFLAFDDSQSNKQPGILIAHDWMGLGKFQKDKAITLAEKGYIVLAADIYGKGIRPKNEAEARDLVVKYKSNRQLLRLRMQAAFNALTKIKNIEVNKIVAMGYCFGGIAVLELARSGVPLVGTVSFHGGLSSPTPNDAKNIKGKVLALHGALDPSIPLSEVEAFKAEMNAANVNLKFISYPGAVHAFTNPKAGNDNSKGAAYNQSADTQSWADFMDFLKEIL